MFQCPPSPPKDSHSKVVKNKESSTSTTEPFPRLQSKGSRSTGGWSWPRLVKAADKQGEHLPSSTAAIPTAANLSSSAPRSRSNSTTSSVNEYAEDRGMPEVKDVTGEAEVEDRRSLSSRASTAGSVQTMTQEREMQGSDKASVKGDPDVDKRHTESSDTSITSNASSGLPEYLEQADISKRPLVSGDHKGGESANGLQTSPDRVNAPRHDLDSLTDDRNTESNASKVSSRQRVSIAEPLPLPRILVQQPSEASDAHVGSPKVGVAPHVTERTLPGERALSGERRDSFEQARARINQEITAKIARLSPKPMSDADAQVQPKTLRPRKSAIALRKTRNACVRKTFLKALLGREIAGPAKTALRKRARGEQVTIEDVSTLETTEAAVGLIP